MLFSKFFSKRTNFFLKLFVFFVIFCTLEIIPVHAEMTNACGGGPSNPYYYNCPANCDVASVSCTTGSNNGNWIILFICSGRSTECVTGEWNIGPGTVYASNWGCGQTVQIDVFTHNCRDSSGNWTCSPADLRGYLVWYTGACGGGGPTPTPTPTPSVCPCTSYNTCQQGPDYSYWRTRPQQMTGGYKVCNYNYGASCQPAGACDCTPVQGSCNWTDYYNTAPSCTISLDRTSVRRGEAPINMTLRVIDQDNGDAVEVSNYTINNSCATVRTAAGTDPFGAVVRASNSNPLIITQTNNFVLDQNQVHGIFNPVNGQSICQATVTMEIRDRIGDQYDTQSVTQCSASFTVINDPPQFRSVELYDKDPVTGLRRSGNLVNGQTVWVASSPETSRPQKCSTPVDPSSLDCASKTPIVTRGNPFEFAFTVSDNNGINDINYSGIWLQRNDIPSGNISPQLPPVRSNARASIQALYNDYADRQIIPFAGANYWVTRADLNVNLFNSVNKLSAYRQGTITGYQQSVSRYKTSRFRSWQIAGFPDCLDRSAKCDWNNVPTTSKNLFDGNVGLAENYAWDVVINGTSYVCYDTTLNAKITSSCDNTCAACIRRAQTNAIQQINATTLRFAYEIKINDQMPEALYSLFVLGDDKVGVPLNNGPAWTSFTKSGVYCPGGSCGTNQFVLGVDKTPPQYNVTLAAGVGDETNATVSSPTDNLSGLGGLYRIVFTREGASKTFLTNQAGTCVFNGVNNCYTGPVAGGFSFKGYGVRGNDVMSAQVCIYDLAGNGGCISDLNNPPFTAQDKWIKTSLGDVYSNTDSSGVGAFQVQLPSNPPNVDTSTATDLLYAPFTSQQNTITSHFFGSAASASGVSGGNNSLQGGISGSYRSLDAVSLFNMNGFLDSSGARYGTGGWYAKILSIANFNCTALKSTGISLPSGFNSNCQEFAGSLAALDSMENLTIKNKLITLTLPAGSVTNVTRDMKCVNTNIIFLASGHLRIPRQLTRNADTLPDGCLFVGAAGTIITIGDTPNNEWTTDIDRFEASIISDGDVKVEVGSKSTNQKFAQLQLFGSVFLSRNAPEFKRDLVFSENRRLPSEWLIYNADMLDLLRPILGVRQTSEIKCGASSHPVCSD